MYNWVYSAARVRNIFYSLSTFYNMNSIIIRILLFTKTPRSIISSMTRSHEAQLLRLGLCWCREREGRLVLWFKVEHRLGLLDLDRLEAYNNNNNTIWAAVVLCIIRIMYVYNVFSHGGNPTLPASARRSRQRQIDWRARVHTSFGSRRVTRHAPCAEGASLAQRGRGFPGTL